METTYNGFTIRLLGHPLYSRDWEVFPVGKEDEVELFEEMSLDDVKEQLTANLN